jgi:hypothetical protein
MLKAHSIYVGLYDNHHKVAFMAAAFVAITGVVAMP